MTTRLIVLLALIYAIHGGIEMLSSEPTLEPTYMPTPSPFAISEYNDCEQLLVNISLTTGNDTINVHELGEIMTRDIDNHYNMTMDSGNDVGVIVQFVSLQTDDSLAISYLVINCNRDICRLFDFLSSDPFKSSLVDELARTYDDVVIYNINVRETQAFIPLSSSDLYFGHIFSYSNAMSIILMCIMFILVLVMLIAYIQNENAYTCSRNLGCKMSDNLYLLRVLQFVAALCLVFFINLNASFVYFKGYAATHYLSFLICAAVCLFIIALNAMFSGLYANRYAFDSEHTTELCQQWLQRHKRKLALLSILSGSLYGSILLVNSNLFGLDMFSMRLAHEQLHKYQTKNMCSIYLAMLMIAVHGYMLFQLRSIKNRISDFGETASAICISVVGCLLIIIIQVVTRLKHYKHEYETTSIDITIEVDNDEDKIVLQQQKNLTKGMQQLLATILEMNASDIEVVGSHRIDDGIVVACKIYHRIKIQSTITKRSNSARHELYEELLLEDHPNDVSGISTSDLQRLNTQSAREVIRQMYYLESPPLTVSYGVSVRTERSGHSRYSRTFTL